MYAVINSSPTPNRSSGYRPLGEIRARGGSAGALASPRGMSGANTNARPKMPYIGKTSVPAVSVAALGKQALRNTPLGRLYQAAMIARVAASVLGGFPMGTPTVNVSPSGLALRPYPGIPTLYFVDTPCYPPLNGSPPPALHVDSFATFGPIHLIGLPDITNKGLYLTPDAVPGVSGGTLTRIIPAGSVVLWPRPYEEIPGPFAWPVPGTNPGVYNRPASLPRPARANPRPGVTPRNWSFAYTVANGKPRFVEARPNRPSIRDGSKKVRMAPFIALAINAATESLDFLDVLYRAAGGQRSILGKRVGFADRMAFLFGPTNGLSRITPESFAWEFAKNQLEDKVYGQIGRRLAKVDPLRRSPGGNSNRPLGIQTGPIF